MGGGKKNEVEETAAERANAEVALNRYKRYMTTYRPFEVKAFEDVTGDRSAETLERRVAGQVNANTAQSMTSSALPPGADPSRGVVQRSVMDPERAAAIADAATQAAGVGRQQKIGGLQQAVNVGSGQAADSQLAFGDFANQALSESISDQQAAFNKRSATTNAVMSSAGALASAGVNSMNQKPPTQNAKPYEYDGGFIKEGAYMTRPRS